MVSYLDQRLQAEPVGQIWPMRIFLNIFEIVANIRKSRDVISSSRLLISLKKPKPLADLSPGLCLMKMSPSPQGPSSLRGGDQGASLWGPERNPGCPCGKPSLSPDSLRGLGGPSAGHKGPPRSAPPVGIALRSLHSLPGPQTLLFLCHQGPGFWPIWADGYQPLEHNRCSISAV